MTAQLYRHIKDWPTDKLRVVLEFFDHEHVRHWYTGLISDIRGELDRRGPSLLEQVIAVQEPETQATYESAMAQLDRLGVPR